MRGAHSPVLSARFALVILFLVVVGGCTVGPDFKNPAMEVPAGWSSPTALSGDASEQSLAQWWTVFQDPVLTSLVEEAIRENLDLKIAESRIRQARASRAVTASALGPTAGGSASLQHSDSGDSQYQLGFDANWEMDIFGGVKREVEAADAELLATVEDRHDVLVTLTAEVARTYIELRTHQQRIDITRKNLELQKHNAELIRKKFEGGFVSGLDVASADAQVANTTAQIPLLARPSTL